MLAKYPWAFVLFVSLLMGSAFGKDSCLDAKLDYQKFLDLTVGEIISISNSSKNIETKKMQISNLIQTCADISKIIKQIVGRARWKELSENEQNHFIKEYSQYLVDTFGQMAMASTNGVKNFTFKQNNTTSTVNIFFHHKDRTKEVLQVEMVIEDQNGILKIVDGKFVELSLVQSQRSMIDRLYDEDKNAIRNFKASNYLKK